MERRTLLRLGVGMATVLLAGRGSDVMAAEGRLLPVDLEPDRDWAIYRRYRLLVVESTR